MIQNCKKVTTCTGTAQNGTVLLFSGYLRSVIMSLPTNLWKGSIIFKHPSIIARSMSMNQSCMWNLATCVPWDLTVWVPNWMSGIFSWRKKEEKISKLNSKRCLNSCSFLNYVWSALISLQTYPNNTVNASTNNRENCVFKKW